MAYFRQSATSYSHLEKVLKLGAYLNDMAVKIMLYCSHEPGKWGH
jgi:hypothetical protein